MTLEDYAASVAEAVGGTAAVAFGAAKIAVANENWVDAATKLRDDFGLVFFSWLSAIDWANDVAAGDPLQEATEERYEVLCMVGDLSEGRRLTLSTDISKDSPSIDSLTGVYVGADWHEREAIDMFGIEFVGHPDPRNLYLPDGFLGHPLRKSYPLVSREVKPWPGTVDVERMPGVDEPSTENPEA